MNVAQGIGVTIGATSIEIPAHTAWGVPIIRQQKNLTWRIEYEEEMGYSTRKKSRFNVQS